MIKEQHVRKAEEWVSGHLGKRYGVHPSRVKPHHKLKDWGLFHEGHYADFARDFNFATHADPDWHGTAIAPPDLIKSVRNKTVGDLVDFVAGQREMAAAATTYIPGSGEIADFMLGYLREGGHDDFKTTTKFGPGDKQIHLSPNLENVIEQEFKTKYGIDIDSSMTTCIGQKQPSVAQVAACISKSINNRARGIQ